MRTSYTFCENVRCFFRIYEPFGRLGRCSVTLAIVLGKFVCGGMEKMKLIVACGDTSYTLYGRIQMSMQFPRTFGICDLCDSRP